MKVDLKLQNFHEHEEGTIVKWLKSPNEFAEGDILYEVETEKVTSEFEAPCNGKMIQHFVAEGENVPVGEKVCKIDKID